MGSAPSPPADRKAELSGLVGWGSVKGGSTGQLTRAYEFAHVSSAIKYCAILDNSGGITDEYPPKGEVDGRTHQRQFFDLAASIGLCAAAGTPVPAGPPPEGTPMFVPIKDVAASIGLSGTAGASAPAGAPPEGAPRFATMCLKEHDLLVTGTPHGTVAVVIKKGAWPAAIADRLRRGGPRPRSVQLAGWVLVVYVAAAIVPGLLLVWSVLANLLDGSLVKDPALVLTLVSGNVSMLLGFTGLISLPGYLRGDVGWRRTLTITLIFNLITWLFPIGYLRPSLILFCAIPIAFLVLNEMGDTMVFFNKA